MNRNPYLLSLPAVLVLAVYSVVLCRSIWLQDSLLGRYRGLARNAIETGDFEIAQTYCERVLQVGAKHEPDDELNLALAKFGSGDADAGQTLLDRLAPDNGVGYSKAHRMKAMQLVAALTGGNSGGQSIPQEAVDESRLSPSEWERVRIHLSRSGLDRPIELADLWTAYYLAAGKPAEAIAQQMDASQLQPERWPGTARLCASLQDERQRKIASDRAETHLAAKIEKNPFDHGARIELARVYVDSDRMEDASVLVLQGLQLVGDEKTPLTLALRRAASDLWLLQFDSIAEHTEEDLIQKHSLVSKAIELDSNNPNVYGKMLDLYQSNQLPENRNAMVRMLEQQIAKGNSIAMAHFALGTAKWIDGNTDDALWHTERAVELDSNLTDVTNNLAWLLSHRDSPDLQRAISLIEMALVKRPADYRYRDTRGTILMKLQRWDDALTDFETILPLVPSGDRSSVHSRLAEIYTALGRSELAGLHREQAAKLKLPGN